MAKIPLFLLLLLGYLSSQSGTVRYYRSEDDFRRDISITEREIGWKPFLEVRYSPEGDVVSRAFYKRKGKLIQFETFAYDSLSGALVSKTVFDRDSTRIQTYLFGPGEPLSEKFIRFAFGVEKVRDFDDRFTAIEFDRRQRPKVTRFFDVDGFLYGVMKFSYDDRDNLRQEDWERMPGNRLIRRFLYGVDSESRIRDIWEYDSSRALVKHLPIDEQGRAPLFLVTFPRDSSFVNDPLLSYTLAEGLTEGRVIWEWEGGKEDAGSPHTATLAREEMERGEYQKLLLRQAPALVDSAVYTVRFNGTGESGYPALEVEIRHVTYDETPPVYTVDSPTAINVPELSFALHEDLFRAEILWVWERGRRDPRSPHVAVLSQDALRKGNYEYVSLLDQVDLQDGSVYTLFFQGTDLAGNTGPALSVSGVRFDTDPPEFVWVKPLDREHMNAPVVSYSLSEELASGRLIWKWQKGADDPQSPHTVLLTGSELKAGKHLYVLPRNAPGLVDGAVYDITVRGTDLAGNASDSLVITQVMYDRTPPAVTAFFPQPGLVVNRPEFVASFSEDLASAGVEWQRVEGDTAVGEPKTASVDSVFLTKGDHRFELPDILPYIEEGVPYTLTVTARDLAANEAAPVVISRVSYDFTPPVITDLYPGDSSFVSSPQISYTVNERLREGVVVWTQVGGEADPASPHVADLTGEELAAGPHENITLSESPLLKDGSIYEMSITGTDLAGNVSGSTVVRHIVYDSTPPEIELVYPFPGASVSTPAVSYRLSELLGEATITWEWSGGNPDERAPHVAGLVGDELSSGYHENVLLQNGPDLVDGAVYTVVARGRDLGLKPAAPSEVAEVTFDRSRPALEIASPAKGSAVNSSNVFYTLSETLAEGTIVWTQTGGREDPFSPHVVPLEGEELEAGEHGEVPLVNSPILMDSSVYDIMFYGEDLAENRSDTLLVGNVLFDKTSPLLEVTYPVAYSVVRNLEVSYSLSEELAEGSITWRRTGGAPDETGEHVALLTGDELAPGDHPGSIPVSAPAGLAEGGVYTVVFQGKDRAGNDARSVQIPGIVFDGTAPRFTGVSPTSGAHVNSARVTYTLSETLESGTVTWTRTGGKDDPRSPHTVPLKGDELTGGTHENVLLSGTPALQDSSLYTVTFVGKDMAENLSDTVSAVQVLYDVSPPRIEVTFPSSNTTVASSRIGYRLSESLGQGSVTWTKTGGTEDPGSPHVQPLTGDELSAGWHRDKELANAPELVEGAVYKITVTGLDPAGNEAEPVTIARVAFDATAPVIANVFPEKGSVVNHTQVAYSLSEYLQSGTVTWIRTAGREDPGSPHIASLRNEELAAGPHPPGTLMERPVLVDSAVYRILFVGTDAAGNVSDTVAVEGITYDVTPPRLTVTYPEPNGVVASPRLTYLLEEDLVEGRVTWTRTGGKEDPRSPHTVFLEGEELETGEHTDMIPANAPSLTDGCIYTVAFEGKDRAGNEVSRVVIPEVMYDATPPVIAQVSPEEGAFVNHSRVSYDLSEALAEATVTWRWVDGKADRQSPHVVSLSGSELDQGMHDGILLSGGPVLTDGATYNLYFEGEDFARNRSDTVTVVRVTYDTTSPVIDVVHPEPEAYISGPAVAYRLSEDLMEGEVVWSWSGGSSDPSAPHVQKMGEPERLAGDHEGELAAPVSLVDGGVYTVTVKGIDRAGNPSRPREIPGVTYDAYPPEIAVQTPAVGSHISRPGITYTLSEDFEWAEIVWIRTGGNADPLSPHRAELTDQQLAGGDHTEVVLALDSPLQDGTVYTVLATGGDRAGNPADTVRVKGVTYDTSAPLVALQAPSPGDFINDTRVSYTLSEPLSKGQITWTHTAGPSDDGSPHLSLLSGTELDSGRHVDRLLAQAPPLVEGAVYTLTFSGVDRAGNPSKAVVVEGVTYDTQAPVITLNAPHDSSHRNHTRMSYTLSESLARGTVTWTRTDGTPDDGSPHEAALTDTALAEGSHVNVSPPPTLALADGAEYAVEIAGEDRAGNRSSSRKATGVVYDITPPTLVLTSPSAEMIINSPSLSYDLSETLKEAFFVWSHSGGRPDPGSPHRTFLTGGSLEAGSHADVVPAEAPELVSGSTYTLTFEGTDLAGNGARPLTVPAVTFDNKPPVIAVEKPASSGFANRPVVTYSLSEMLESLEVKWIRTGGSEDPGSPHLVRLEGRELEPGDHPDVAPVPVPPLVDGSVYRVVFTGADLAGNEAAEVAVSDVTFDAAPPVVALSTPGSGSAVNSAGLSYRLSEDLRQGSVTWERIGGRDDPRSPHVSRLTVEERAAGTHENRTLVETPPLVDGAVYRITLQGEDAAGNRADSVAVDSVVFDVSPPVIVANFPAPSSSVNSPVVSYRLGEDLREGTITWTRTGGETDPGSPHVLTLAPGELTAGDHQNLLPEPAPELVTGAVYSVSFDGQDRAGNRASGMVIESVTFDSEKPLIAVQTPGGTPYLNRPNLTYELSETLKEATVTWSWESGEADPGAPHVTPLTGQELAAGKHLDAPFTNGPRLQDGAVYTVTFTGTDPAGNEGEPVTLPGIAFDATPPVIRVTSPVPGQYLNSTAISYGLSEDLVVGTVTWTRTGGNEDTGSPHTISLSAEEMAAGDHPETVLTNQLPLVDGTTYTLTMTGQDPAGNAPEEITVVGLTFDSVPPEVVWHEPSGGSFVNDLFLTYALSESLAVGQITLSRTGGEADPSSPYEIDLTGEDLSAGRHDHTVPPGLPVPVSGAVYALTFQGSDLAGNEAEPAVVDGVTFDNTPPAFTVMAPGNSDYVNHTRLTYELSERLATGRVTWNPVDGESPQVMELTEGEREEGVHEDISLQDSPELVDGQAYDILFEGSDFAGNEAPPVTVTGVTYDVTSPKLKVELNSPIPHTFKKDTPVSITSSEEMSEIVFTWVGESGVNDPASPHRLPVPEEYLVEGRHDDIILPGIEGLQEGTSYTLTVTGKDLADNESRPQSVENIDIIRDLTGDWLWKGALLTAVWSFQEGGGFVQGVMMGTRISEKEQGQFRVDFTTRPYELMIHFETGVKRYALFEFTGSNSMRVVAGQKKPSSWSDGDLMNFEYREPEVP